MTPNDVKIVLQEVLGGGVFLSTSAFVVFVCGSMLAVAAAAVIGGFFSKRGETAAVKRDLETIKETLRQTTRATEEIKAEISGAAWLNQKRFDLKWDCYAEMVRNLGEIHTIIREAISLNTRSPDYAHERERKGRAIGDAMMKFRQFGSVARIAVAPSVRTVLSRFGDEWNKSANEMDLGIVARWGWLVIADIARNDLFGEPREMSDEFTGEVDVRP
jgi:hypothetical protein